MELQEIIDNIDPAVIDYNGKEDVLVYDKSSGIKLWMNIDVDIECKGHELYVDWSNLNNSNNDVDEDLIKKAKEDGCFYSEFRYAALDYCIHNNLLDVYKYF